MLQIPATDHGALYVLDYTGDAPAVLSDEAVLQMVGPVVLNLDFVDLVTPEQRREVSLPELIRQGYEMPLTAEQADRLRQLSGHVLLIMSRAFGGQAQDITLPDATTLVMVLRDNATVPPAEQITSAAAAGVLTGPPVKPRKSDARMSGMVATAALLVMFALVGLMVWVGR
ncbi:MAG: hypothetical protein II336_07660 [Loktanella sp.]|nr:hypothetical protein [Loktanella sp.]